MPFSWKKAFTQGKITWKDDWALTETPVLPDLPSLKRFLDLVHIRYCLLKPYSENVSYPVLDPRELMPSFEADLWEHKRLPGFSLVALERPINYFHEIFQFDLLRPIGQGMNEAEINSLLAKNLATLMARIHKGLHEQLRLQFARVNLCSLEYYSELLPFLLNMDRAQVMSLIKEEPGRRQFALSGVYASFPSDLDTEIKRYGLRMGKFAVGDNELYERNRTFVYQYLMELYGFPIASERRTSAALFARRLHKMGEKFLVRTLGQSDRCITTIWNDTTGRHYPKVEKTALVAIDEDQRELLSAIADNDCFVDREKRVVLVRLTYRQHKYSEDNVRQDRALSVESQEVVNPLTGEALQGVNIVKDPTNMFMRVNDIVRGEYTGRIVYKRTEIVENTDTDEKRLKFLYAWLIKHQRRMISYSDDFFANMSKVLDNYLLSPENYNTFSHLNELYQEVLAQYSYIQQARRIRVLEELRHRHFNGKQVDYSLMLTEAVAVMHDLKFEVVSYFDSLASSAIKICEGILNDKYLLRNYINVKKEVRPNARRIEIKKNYGKLVALVDEFKAIRKSRAECLPCSDLKPDSRPNPRPESASGSWLEASQP